ncbi:MAG: ketoacyl-ACP synthase III [Fibrobacter sp.]|uniref:3-oxoacyl-ACP synthase III family protein n=1 Tax=Fibrobacter sp. TaxID=35828 RepID=UPI0025BD2D73|nr:ketoacyl-ACP synthase III [Fibrobacter sp.]MBQ7080095.1 ketoacyl-ACP synthase III [Fibrobacter sp.]
MVTAEFNNICISGIAAAVPTQCVDAREYEHLFGQDVVRKNIITTGVRQAYHASENQTSSDLAYIAAKKLLKEMNVDPKSIDVLIFTAAYLDYQVPPTSCVLQYRLGLSTDCIVFDTNLACSGFVYSLQTMGAILNSSSAKRGLILTGDITSRVVSPMDKSRMIFGDAGTATLVEKKENSEKINIAMKTDGSRFKSIIVPAGAYRNVNASHERTLWSDGNTRSDYDLFMNGMDVFSFSMSDVPKMAIDFMGKFNYAPEDFDAYVFHQPNLFILKHLIKKIGAPQDKMCVSLDRYGNTSVCAIPLTICDSFANESSVKKLFLYGFGVGLSWACASVSLDTTHVLAIERTDDFFAEGRVEH